MSIGRYPILALALIFAAGCGGTTGSAGSGPSTPAQIPVSVEFMGSESGSYIGVELEGSLSFSVLDQDGNVINLNTDPTLVDVSIADTSGNAVTNGGSTSITEEGYIEYTAPSDFVNLESMVDLTFTSDGTSLTSLNAKDTDGLSETKRVAMSVNADQVDGENTTAYSYGCENYKYGLGESVHLAITPDNVLYMAYNGTLLYGGLDSTNLYVTHMTNPVDSTLSQPSIGAKEAADISSYFAEPQQLVSTGYNPITYVDIAVSKAAAESTDDVAAYWYSRIDSDPGEGGLFMSDDGGSSWTGLTTSCPGWIADLEYDTNGTLHLAYICLDEENDVNRGYVYYTTCDLSGCNTPILLSPAGRKAMTYQISIAVQDDEEGDDPTKVYVTWALFADNEGYESSLAISDISYSGGTATLNKTAELDNYTPSNVVDAPGNFNMLYYNTLTVSDGNPMINSAHIVVSDQWEILGSYLALSTYDSSSGTFNSSTIIKEVFDENVFVRFSFVDSDYLGRQMIVWYEYNLITELSDIRFLITDQVNAGTAEETMEMLTNITTVDEQLYIRQETDEADAVSDLAGRSYHVWRPIEDIEGWGVRPAYIYISVCDVTSE